MPSAPRPTPVQQPLSAAAGLLGIPTPSGAQQVFITGVTLNSRAVHPGDLYAALPGYVTHGARFAADAVVAGATALLTDPDGEAECRDTGRPVLVVPDPRAVVGELSAWLYGRPGDRLLLVGVTGTNGKTTVVHQVHAGLTAAGHPAGMIGTTGIQLDGVELPSARTTPEAPDLQALLAVMVERGLTAAAMEVSSHALALGRVDGLVFDVVVFTNLSQDHLDFHGDLESYFAAKAGLFTPRRARRGIICVDDDWGRRLARQASIAVTTYSGGPGLRTSETSETSETVVTDTAAPATGLADWRATDAASQPDGSSRVRVAGPDGEVADLHVPLPGAFNVTNAVGAFAALRMAGVESGVAAAALAAAAGAPGRLERIAVPGAPVGFVDYAHTPDAVHRVLDAVAGVTAGRVLVVLGCGGDRDRDKRDQMGATAALLADLLIVTDDNPRSEDPAAIRARVMTGAQSVAPAQRAEIREVPDRRAAIRAAVRAATPDDVVLVLGKGHEQGQEIAGISRPFDDRTQLQAAMEEWAT